jgi:hypothetical protein
LPRDWTFAARSLGALCGVFKKNSQKPSSARPTQLNANIEEAATARVAKVAKVLTDGITEPRFRPEIEFCRTTFVQSRQ